MKPVRNSVKAIITHQGQLLVLEMRDQQGPWFQLPGGGQNSGETLHQALTRECWEEVNARIITPAIKYVKSYAA